MNGNSYVGCIAGSSTPTSYYPTVDDEDATCNPK